MANTIFLGKIGMESHNMSPTFDKNYAGAFQKVLFSTPPSD